MNLQARWMKAVDFPEVLEIDQLCFEFKWSEDDFIRALRQRNCIGMVATVLGDDDKETVIGFMIYELWKARLEILNFAVHPSCWRRGVGRAMVEKLKSKLSIQRRTMLTCNVRESNLAAQSFFRALGLRAKMILHDQYEETDEDSYRFVYRVPVCEGVAQ